MGRRRNNKRRRRWGREGGGNRENEQGVASSPLAATLEESLRSDSLHQSAQPARSSFPPSPPMPSVPVPVAPTPPPSPIPAVPPPSPSPSYRFGPNCQVVIEGNLRVCLRAILLLHFAQTVVRFLELWDRKLAGTSHQTPGPVLSAGQVPVQGTAGDQNRDLLPEEERKTTITAENTGSSHIQRTQSADNITSRTQQTSLEGPDNMEDIAEQMGNQIEAEQGTTSKCIEDNSDDVDSG